MHLTWQILKTQNVRGIAISATYPKGSIVPLGGTCVATGRVSGFIPLLEHS